ncbi:hypothetical protein [Jannaschia marina]|uniref:hypothetical protein n=1 Tax=Jannaschia marina TaxID=2741674 RepID=UPI0015CE028C|nr:hypothetical protein [Jannaschia marina]
MTIWFKLGSLVVLVAVVCEICKDIGLVDQVDAWPAVKRRTVECPVNCAATKEAAIYLTDRDRKWQRIETGDTTVAPSVYFSVSKALADLLIGADVIDGELLPARRVVFETSNGSYVAAHPDFNLPSK